MPDYEIRIRKSSKLFRNELVEYDEKYAFDPAGREEVYLKEFVAENRTSMIESYKRMKGLLTSQDIKDIRGRYQMTQKEYALALGFGEITVHRFEKGSIQSYADDEIMRLSADANDMYKLLNNNRDCFSEENFVRLLDTVRDLQKLQRNRIAHFEMSEFTNLTLTSTNVLDVARYMIKKYNHQYDWLDVETVMITPAKLQLLLYFVEALSLCIYQRSAFTSDIYLGKLGPYIREISHEYGKKERLEENGEVYLSNGLHKIADTVIESYGQLELLLLVSICKSEPPCANKRIDELIERSEIREYFSRIYQ